MVSGKLIDAETINAPLQPGTKIQLLMCCSGDETAAEGGRKWRLQQILLL